MAGTTCRIGELLNAPTAGSLTVTPLQVLDSAALASTAQPIQALEVSTDGAASVGWAAQRALGSAWLSLNATTGTTPATVTVVFNPSGLGAGAYRDTIILAPVIGAGEPTRVPVEFRIQPCALTPSSVDAPITDSLRTSDCAAPNGAGQFDRLYSFTASTGDSVSIAATASAFGPVVVLDTVAGAAGNVLARSVGCAFATQTACIINRLLPRTGTYVVEVTSVSASETGGFALSLTRPHPPSAPDSLVQVQQDSASALPLGGAVTQAAVVFRGVLIDADLGDSVSLQVEVRPVGTVFTGVPTTTGSRVASRARAWATARGLTNFAGYHWQARAIDMTGRFGAWTPFGSNAENSADFTVAVPQLPNTPTSLSQFQADGATAIALGGVTNSQSVTLRATVGGPSPTGQFRLDVEIQPVGTAFTNTASASSAPVANGGTASATLAALSDNARYHWQARTVDQANAASAWTSFGGNAETDADFKVSIAPTRLAVTVQPASVAAGTLIAPAVQVAAQDAMGNAIPSYTGAVTVAIGSNPVGGTLSGTTTVSAVAGVTTFANLSLDKVGTGYTLQFGTGTLTTTSATFNVTPSLLAQLVFTQQPTSTVAGGTIAPAVRVTARDASGNTATAFTGNVTVSIATNAGGGTLSGTATVAAVAGVATFSTLSINKAGIGYTLAAASGSLTGGTSGTFNIVAVSAVQSTVAATPISITASSGATMSTITATAKDAGGNLLSGATVLLAVTGTGNTLTQPIASTNGSGVATGTLSSTVAGAKVVSATVSGVAITQVASITITSAAAASITVNAGNGQSATVNTAVATAPSVMVRDAFSNPVAGVSVTFAIASGGGSVAGTNPVTTGSNGIATIGSWKLGTTAGANGLTVTAIGLTGSPVTFTATGTAGAATQLTFTAQPSATVAGAAIVPAVRVTATDAFGNLAQSFTGKVAIAIAANPAGGKLSGTTPASAVAGVAEFSDLRIDKAGVGYTLATSSPGLAGSTSTSFSITAGP